MSEILPGIPFGLGFGSPPCPLLKLQKCYNGDKSYDNYIK